MEFKTQLMDAETMRRAYARITHEIAERNPEDFALVGIRTRGVPFAGKIAENTEKFFGKRPDLGILDITLYRDDLSIIAEHPVINSTDVPFSVNGRNIVLCDDVLYTGRTVRAAIECIMEMGRPKTIQLAVLVDRGHRELPIRADFVGKNVPTSQSELVTVKFPQTDGDECVELYGKGGNHAEK